MTLQLYKDDACTNQVPNPCAGDWYLAVMQEHDTVVLPVAVELPCCHQQDYNSIFKSGKCALLV